MARVMLMEAETYLMDEPSSALDWETEQFMLAILGCTALTVILFVTLGYKTFFTSSQALRDVEE